MRILARSTSLARADPIAASASWLGTAMIRYSTRSVLILSLPPRRFGSSVMDGSSVGSLWSIVGQSRVGPHHPRACGSGVSYLRDRAGQACRPVPGKDRGLPYPGPGCGFIHLAGFGLDNWHSSPFEARKYPKPGGPALPSPLILSGAWSTS